MRVAVISTIALTALHAQPPQALTLAACGLHGEIEVICGIQQPEDLERTPDGKFLLATQYLNEGRGSASGGGVVLFNLTSKTFTRIKETVQRDQS